MGSKRAWLIMALVVFLVTAIFGTTCASEKGYPSRQIEIIINFPPGGPLDTATRIIQPSLQAAMGVPVILTNQGGAAGALGANFVSKAKPDGYTLLSSNNGAFTIAPNVNPSVTYRHTDFISICTFAADPGVITSKPDAPWKTLEELVAYAKKNPGKLNYATPGIGAVPFFSMEMFKLAHGLDIVPVHFQGTGPVKNAIMGGHVDLAACGLSAVIPLIKAGSVVPLVTTASKRLADFPAIPTLAEKGFPEACLNMWLGLLVPQKCPKEVAERLSREMEKIMKDPAIAGQLEKAGVLVDYLGGAETTRRLEEEYNLVEQLVKKTGVGK